MPDDTREKRIKAGRAAIGSLDAGIIRTAATGRPWAQEAVACAVLVAADHVAPVRSRPVEITDEMVERAYRAFLGSDAAYVPNRVGLRNMSAALRAAWETDR